MAAAGSTSARHGRTWGERVAIGATIVAAVVCFLDRRRPRRRLHGAARPRRRRASPTRPTRPTGADGASTPAPTAPGDGRARRDRRRPSTTTTPAPTFPPADPTAKNFLITGADNGACVDPDSPYAPAFGDAESGRVGERSDTIMIFRVDPAAGRVAVLSFPRDLYVTIADSGNRSRINSAYRRDEPQRLIDTIYQNFGVVADHFIQVDFCTFKTLVDAVGGVTVPFEYPARDPNTGLNVPEAGLLHVRRRPRPGLRAVAQVRVRGPAGQRRLARRPDVGPRAHLAPAGLPAPHAVERARQGPAQPERRRRPDRGGDERRRRDRLRALAGQAAGVRRRAQGRRARAPSRRTRSRRPAARSTAPPCSSRASTATTCRPCWPCSAARRRSPRRPSRCSRRRRPTCPAPPRRPRRTRRRRRRRPRRRRSPPPTGPAENTFGIVPPRDVTC